MGCGTRRGDRASAVLLLLEKLTPTERAAYILRESFAYPYPEIAAIFLHLSPANARQLVSRARKHIARPNEQEMVPLVAAAAEQAEQHQEEIHEVQVERQGAHNRIRAHLAVRQRERHVPQPLRVVGGEPREHHDAAEGDDELQGIVLPEDPHDRREDDANEAHEEELAPAFQALRRHGAEKPPAIRTSRR